MDRGRFGELGAVFFSTLLVLSLLAATGLGATAALSPVPGDSSIDADGAFDPEGSAGFEGNGDNADENGSDENGSGDSTDEETDDASTDGDGSGSDDADAGGSSDESEEADDEGADADDEGADDGGADDEGADDGGADDEGADDEGADDETTEEGTDEADDEDTDSVETVVVRFEPYGAGGGVGAQNAATSSVDDLKDHANSTKDPFRQRFGGGNGGEVGADDIDTETAAVTIKREFWIANAALIEIDTDRVPESKLLETPGVERVHENFEVEIDSAVPESGTDGGGAVASDSVTADASGFTYGLDMINVPAAWDRFDEETEPGAGATVAVLDTGVDDDHADLTVDEWAEFNFLGNEVQGSDPNDGDGHGTHVAGTVTGAQSPAGGGDNYGVAPGASLYGVKVLDDDGAGTLAQVLAGMEWATERDEVDVLQMSLGSEGTEDDFIEPVRNAKSEGKIVVASVGNDGEGSSSSPGNVFESFSVGAVDDDEAVAFFSGSQTLNRDEDWDEPPEDWPESYDVPTVVAPGVSIESADTGTGDGTTLSSGTSMSAPHAAGTVALIVSATDGIARESTIREAMTETARQPDGESFDSDRFGDNGLIDADAAIGKALDSLDDPVISGTVTETETGDPIEGATVSSDAEGISSVETDANGEYELIVPAETQELTVEAFGFDSETREITPELGEERTENFDLNQIVDAQLVKDARSRFEASSEDGEWNGYDIEFDVANVEEYTIRIDEADTEAFDEEFDDGSTVEITVGEDTKTIDLSDSEPTASFTELDRTTDPSDETDVFSVDIAPHPDLELSRIAFNHDFDRGDDPTVSLGTRRTTIQPDTVQLGDRNLRNLARFVDDGSTVNVNKNTDVSVDNDDPTAVDLDRSLTLTGDDDVMITVSDGTDTDTDLEDPIGISVTSDGVTIDGPTIKGNSEGDNDVELTTGIDIKDVGIGTSDIDADSGSVVSLDNIAVDNAETGLRIDNAAGIGGETIDITATGTGISVTGSDDVTLSDVTITDATTGVELDEETEGADLGVTIGSGTDVDPAVSFGNVEADENEVSVTFEGAVRTEPVTVGGKNATVGEGEEPEDDDNNQIRPKNEDEEELTPLDVFLELDKIEGEENQRIDLTVPYTETEERRFDETSLALYRFDDGNDEWEDAPLDTDLDSDARTLSVTVDSFSTFGMYGEEQAFYDVSNLDITQEEAHRNQELEASADIENIGGDDAENERTAELRLGSDIEGDESDDYEVVASKDIKQLHTGDSIEITLSGDVLEDVSLGADQDVGIVAVGPNGDEGVAKEAIDVVDRALSGTVTAEDTDDPIEGATVTIEAADNGFETTETTDESGDYDVEGLDDGDYTVTADADSFGSASATVAADRFEVTIEDFELDPNPGSIQGTVRDNDTDEAIEGATVEVGGDSVETDDDGAYSIAEVARGDRSVTASAGGYDDSTETVSVESDETTTANFDLDPVPIFAITEIDVPGSVRQGETLSVDATVQNDGAGAGEAAIELDALGGTTDETITLDPGEETTATLSRSVSTGTDTGTYDATVSTPDDSRTEPFEVRERRTSSGGGGGGGGSSSGGGGGGGGPTGPLPEDLRLKGFPSPSVPATATTGEEITISFGLRNRGTTVTDPVLVLANGEEIGRHDRFIGFGAEVDVEIRHTFLEPGVYAIRIEATGLGESDAVLGEIEVTGDSIAPGTGPDEDPAADTRTETPEETPTPDDDSSADDPPPPDDLPGFGPAVAILALLFASLLARWRRPDA